ncbi:MAG: GNAT family N-acetyltransferase [Rhodospirillaceae bacterium]|nr:GNAT family N-acetyltransferase [Rhodospirillaceae bacterium]
MNQRLPRPMRAADVSAVAALYKQCLSETWSAASMGQFISRTGVIALLMEDPDVFPGDPVAFMIARVVGEDGEILSLGVLSQRRRRGVAARLVTAILRRAAAMGARQIFLEVAEDNNAARALYAGLGFDVVGRRTAYYRRRDAAPVDALTMSRKLAQEAEIVSTLRRR